jgi:hypothetical protein
LFSLVPSRSGPERNNLTTDPVTAKTYAYANENKLTSASGGVTLNYDPLDRPARPLKPQTSIACIRHPFRAAAS